MEGTIASCSLQMPDTLKSSPLRGLEDLWELFQFCFVVLTRRRGRGERKLGKLLKPLLFRDMFEIELSASLRNGSLKCACAAASTFGT